MVRDEWLLHAYVHEEHDADGTRFDNGRVCVRERRPSNILDGIKKHRGGRICMDFFLKHVYKILIYGMKDFFFFG